MATQTTTPPTKSIPYMPGLPLLGNLTAFNKDRLGFLQNVFQTCGEVGGFHFGPYSLVMFSASDHVQSILVEHAEDFKKGERLRRAFLPVTGNGLFTSEGGLHRRQRKLMAPVFAPRQIVGYAATMTSYGERLQAQWQDGTIIDLGREMTHVTMSIVGKVLFDTDFLKETDELGSAMQTALAHVNDAASMPFPLPLSLPLPRNIRTRQALATLRQRIQQMIDERRSSALEKEDCLSLLLRARDEDGRMSDQQVFDESLTLFGAGHETTATTLTWAWYLLITHPDAYEKVQREVDSVLQGRSPTYTDLTQLPYTLKVFKETLRLYPPAFATSRTALSNVEIGGYPVRKQETVLISPYVIHRRADYFPDPEKFDPERFSPENEKHLPRYAFLPFGAGPRICIGNHFATMEGHLLLATLAQRVTFDLVSGQNIVAASKVTIRPKDGVKVVVRRRGVRSE